MISCIVYDSDLCYNTWVHYMFGGQIVIYPKEEYGSVYQIPFEEYYKKGYRAIIFDIDNTLVPHGAPADRKAIQLGNQLRDMGFRFCFLSNNNKKRVEPFAKVMNAEFRCNAGKPFKKGYLEMAEALQVEREKILFIGDQLFTDILGANRVGFYSILVGRVNRKETFMVHLKRYPEQVSMYFYHRKHKKQQLRDEERRSEDAS